MAANSPATVFFEVAEDPGEPDPVVSMESVGSGLNMGTVLFFGSMSTTLAAGCPQPTQTELAMRPDGSACASSQPCVKQSGFM